MGDAQRHRRTSRNNLRASPYARRAQCRTVRPSWSSMALSFFGRRGGTSRSIDRRSLRTVYRPWSNTLLWRHVTGHPAGPSDPRIPRTQNPEHRERTTTRADDMLRPRALMASFNLPTALTERYEILATLGAGGMGVVYKARDRETNTIVALKVIHPAIACQPDILNRFRAELVLARQITHKNVCRAYDFGRFDDVVAISMEYV